MSTTAEPSVSDVPWSLDVVNSEDDDISIKSSTLFVKKIPRYDEPDRMDEELKRKFDEKLLGSGENSKVDALLKKSIIGPGYEQQSVVPTHAASRRALRRERKKARDATKGPAWFNLPAQEMTEEVKNDLDLLRMRSILDPRHFYKNNDLNHTPRYFQIGTVVETPADFFNGRIPKSQRKRTLVSELMADAESRAFQKKKFKSIVDTSRQRHRKTKPKNTKKAKKA